jgi:Ser/Thr protein kinase RdoA (MazF antagonist)
VTPAVTEGVYRPAATAALAAFPIAVRSLELVNVSENITWRVLDETGRCYVLRLHRPGYHTLDELIAERAWIRALDAAGIHVPRGIRTRTGAEYVTVQVPAAGEMRHAGLAHWTDGEVLEDVLAQGHSADQLDGWFLQLGALIARLHNHASAWTVPATFTRHALDADGLMGQQPFWGRFWEHEAFTGEQSTLLASARERLHAALSDLPQTPDTYSVIHADLHPGNLLVYGDSLGIIDFDDAGFGWHVYDLAVALRSYRAEPFFANVQAALIQGYRRHRTLPDAAIALIPTFILVRRLASVGWIMQRPELGVALDPATANALCDDVREYLCG